MKMSVGWVMNIVQSKRYCTFRDSILTLTATHAVLFYDINKCVCKHFLKFSEMDGLSFDMELFFIRQHQQFYGLLSGHLGA